MAVSGPVIVDQEHVRRVTGEVATGLAGSEHEFRGRDADLLRRARGSALVRDAVDRLQHELLVSGGDGAWSDEYERVLEERVTARLFGVGEFERLLADELAENVLRNGPGPVIVRRSDGSRELVDWSVSDDELNDMLSELAGTQGRSEHRFDVGHPELSIRLPDGSRLTAVREVSGHTVFALRRHRHTDVDLDDLFRLGTVSELLRSLLTAAVRSRRNILVTGGTNAGKTTALRALLNCIDPWERLITIEDALELHLSAYERRHRDVVELEAREANLEGQGAVTMRDLTRLALRLSPDRVIVGEVRGAEILEMLGAMGQGNDGSMGTIHARSSKDAILQCIRYGLRAPERLSPEAMAVDIAASLDLIVHVRMLRDGRRVVSSVREVIGYRGADVITSEILAPDGLGRAVPTGTSIEDDTMDRLIEEGFDTRLLDLVGGGWTW
jgi:pilus assembly protein CpaF